MSAFDPRFKTLKNVFSKDERDGVWDAIAKEAMSRQSQDDDTVSDVKQDIIDEIAWYNS